MVPSNQWWDLTGLQEPVLGISFTQRTGRWLESRVFKWKWEDLLLESWSEEPVLKKVESHYCFYYVQSIGPIIRYCPRTTILAGNSTVSFKHAGRISLPAIFHLPSICLYSIIKYCNGWFIWQNNLIQGNERMFKIVSMLWRKSSPLLFK